MIASPKLKARRPHDLRLHSAHVAADRDRVGGRLIQQMMPPQPKAGDLIDSVSQWSLRHSRRALV
jgi:hypothetical protein